MTNKADIEKFIAESVPDNYTLSMSIEIIATRNSTVGDYQENTLTIKYLTKGAYPKISY